MGSMPGLESVAEDSRVAFKVFEMWSHLPHCVTSCLICPADCPLLLKQHGQLCHVTVPPSSTTGMPEALLRGGLVAIEEEEKGW